MLHNRDARDAKKFTPAPSGKDVVPAGIRIPKDLLETYKPQEVITRTIKSRDYKEACKLVNIKNAHVELYIP